MPLDEAREKCTASELDFALENRPIIFSRATFNDFVDFSLDAGIMAVHNRLCKRIFTIFAD